MADSPANLTGDMMCGDKSLVQAIGQRVSMDKVCINDAIQSNSKGPKECSWLTSAGVLGRLCLIFGRLNGYVYSDLEHSSTLSIGKRVVCVKVHSTSITRLEIIVATTI
jgi:hypothetical protein